LTAAISGRGNPVRPVREPCQGHVPRESCLQGWKRRRAAQHMLATAPRLRTRGCRSAVSITVSTTVAAPSGARLQGAVSARPRQPALQPQDASRRGRRAERSLARQAHGWMKAAARDERQVRVRRAAAPAMSRQGSSRNLAAAQAVQDKERSCRRP